MIRPVLMCVCLMLLPGVREASAAGPEDGAKVYAAQKCSLCHSIAGKGNPKGALDGVGARLTPDEMRQWLTSPKEMAARHNASRKPPMKSFAALPKGDLDALVAYLQTLKTAPATAR